MNKPPAADHDMIPAILRYPPERREAQRAQQLSMCASTIRHDGEDAADLINALLLGGWLTDEMDALRYTAACKAGAFSTVR